MPKPKRKRERASQTLSDNNADIKSDVLGSYTGTPLNSEVPVQDADDL